MMVAPWVLSRLHRRLHPSQGAGAEEVAEILQAIRSFEVFDPFEG